MDILTQVVLRYFSTFVFCELGVEAPPDDLNDGMFLIIETIWIVLSTTTGEHLSIVMVDPLHQNPSTFWGSNIYTEVRNY